MQKYNPKKIEEKWQSYWQTNNVFEAGDSGEKKFILVEFPFPSGDGLHMGHLRSYTAADLVSRYYRMKGFNVMYPIGWDAFGLPAENYAIKHGKQPAETTAKNIENIRKQLHRLGYSIDWSREINTTDPNYYKWTQWLFLQFYKAGLAYESTGLINWCPKDKTGLANEEVIGGHCERCGTKVEKKELRQWYLKITEYAEKLLAGLNDLPEWPERVRTEQANWIGKKEGAEIDFQVVLSPPKAGEGSPDFSTTPQNDISVKVFTTRPDTIFGATYLVVAPEHSLIETLADKIENIDEVRAYAQTAKDKEELERIAEGKEKTGVELKGIRAINPATKEDIPVWVADYVLGGYGTGAIMAVPAHDERDNEFAKKFGLEIRQVVAPRVVDPVNPPREDAKNTDRNMLHAIVMHPTEDKILSLKWKTHPWQTFITGGIEDGEDVLEAAKREVFEETGYKNMEVIKLMPYIMRAEFYAAHKEVNRKVNANVVMLKLTDLAQEVVSAEEQEQFEPVWIDSQDMKNLSPVSELAYILDWVENGDKSYTGEGVLINSGEFSDQLTMDSLPKMAEKFGKQKTTYKLRDWVFSRQRYWGEPIPLIHCEKDGVVPVPDDQLPVVLPEVKNYEPTGTGESPLAAIDEWVNTTCPECGGPAKRETNTMPQWAGSSWYFLRYTDPNNEQQFASSEKLKQWLPVDIYFGGMEHTTLHLLYSRFWNIFLHDQGLVPVSEPYTKRVPHGMILAEDGSKMSKSKGNVINPDDLVKQHGADTVRMYEMFLGPHEDSVLWSEKGIIGVARFLERIWNWINTAEFSEHDEETVSRELHKTIKKVTEDIEAYRFNTVVSNLMSFHNAVKDSPITKDSAKAFLQLLHPLAPHIASELYEQLGGENIDIQPWPKYDESMLVSDTITIAVQVNGKVRDELIVSTDSTQEEIETKALASEKVQALLSGQSPKRIIYVENRLVNIVV